MDIYDLFCLFCIGLVAVAVVCVGVVVFECVDWGDDVYEYYNTTVLDMSSYSVTTMTVVSTGKSTSVIPVTSTQYTIITGKGNVSVDGSDYHSLKKGDGIVISKNLNKSSLNYVCRLEV